MTSAIETSLFIYRGKNRKGEKVDGELRANNLATVCTNPTVNVSGVPF